MNCSTHLETNLCLAPGRAFSWTVRPALTPEQPQYAEITEYTGIAPLLAVAPGHGLSAGWPVAIVDASGMLPDSGPAPASVLDADTLAVPWQIGPLPAYTGGFEPYEGGHYLRSLVPLPLAGATAQWSVFRGEETLLEIPAAIDDTTHSVTVELDALETQALTFVYARHELRLVQADLSERSLACGSVSVLSGCLQPPLRALSVELEGVSAGGALAVIS